MVAGRMAMDGVRTIIAAATAGKGMRRSSIDRDPRSPFSAEDRVTARVDRVRLLQMCYRQLIGSATVKDDDMPSGRSRILRRNDPQHAVVLTMEADKGPGLRRFLVGMIADRAVKIHAGANHG